MSFPKLLKDALFSVNFLISLAVGVFLLFSPIAQYLWIGIKSGLRLDYAYLFNTAHETGSFVIFAPLLAALPFSARFCTELECGMIKPILLRQRSEKYLAQRFAVNGIAGGLSLALPKILLTITIIILGMPYRKEDVYEGFQTVCYGTVFEELQFTWGGLGYILICIGLVFLSGAIWANIGLCMSAFIPNKILAVGFPIVIYYGVTVVLVATPIFGLSPMNLSYPTTFDSIPLWLNVIVQISELLLVGIVFILRGKERLRNV
jgi:hypothetical protein